MLRFINPSFLLLAVLLGWQVHGSDLRDEEGGQAAVPPAPQPIQFPESGIAYHPATKKFEGQFFDEATHTAQQLAGFYLERFNKVSSHELQEALKKVQDIKSRFSSPQIEQLEQLEQIKLEEGNKELTQDDLETYQVLRTLKGELLFAETEADFYKYKVERYKKRFDVMSNMNSILQHTFYLEMYHASRKNFRPDNSPLINMHRYQGGIGEHILNQRIQINFQLPALCQVSSYSELDEFKSLGGTSYMQEWLNNLESFMNILTSYLMKEAYKRNKKIEIFEKYSKAKNFGASEKSLSSKKEKITSKLMNIEFSLKYKIQPLAKLCLDFATKLEDFQKEAINQPLTSAFN